MLCCIQGLSWSLSWWTSIQLASQFYMQRNELFHCMVGRRPIFSMHQLIIHDCALVCLLLKLPLIVLDSLDACCLIVRQNNKDLQSLGELQVNLYNGSCKFQISHHNSKQNQLELVEFYVFPSEIQFKFQSLTICLVCNSLKQSYTMCDLIGLEQGQFTSCIID